MARSSSPSFLSSRSLASSSSSSTVWANFTTEIGKLSAEAVLREYEATAKEIESIATELLERVKQCEAMTRNAIAVTDELKGVAAHYREEAKRVFEQIETCSLVVAEARKTCTDLKDKIAAPLSSDRLKRKK